MMAKRNLSLVATFALLSFGYVMSSYQEVRSVVLHTHNLARLTVAVESFLKSVSNGAYLNPPKGIRENGDVTVVDEEEEVHVGEVVGEVLESIAKIEEMPKKSFDVSGDGPEGKYWLFLSVIGCSSESYSKER